MNRYLNEDKLPQKLPVYFSSKIQHSIDSIKYYNQNNTEGLSQWNESIGFLKKYISNPSIAFDYANRYSHYRNGAIHMVDVGFDVTFIVTLNKAQTKSFVYVFKLVLKPQEFGLKIPPTLQENKIRYTNNTMKTNKKVIRLTESDLHNMITEAVKTALNELDWKTYARARDKAAERGDMQYWRDKGETMPDILNKAVKNRFRTEKFSNGARNAFNRDFGYERGRYGDDDYCFAGMVGDFNAGEEFGPAVRGYSGKHKNIVGNLEPLRGKGFTYKDGREVDMTPDEFFDDNAEAAQAFKKARKEFDTYRNKN